MFETDREKRGAIDLGGSERQRRNARRIGLVLSLVLVGLLGCGDGGGGPSDGPCSTLKIAGGEGCQLPPPSVAVVATDVGYCSGVYVTTRHVLTAAHCIPRGAARIVVFSEGVRAPVSRSFVHPAYDGSINSPFDVAVVTVPEQPSVSPIPLMLSRPVQPGDTVTVYGFGLDEDGNDVVRRIENGESALKATFLKVLAADAGTVRSLSDGGDTCRGDSGGSLLLDGADGQPGIVAIVRAGPDICVPGSRFPSDNSNAQSQAVVDFIRTVAPGTGSN
jgi:hypothetical protein